MPPEYTAISVYPAARDAIREFSARAGGVLLKRLSLSEALLLAAKIAAEHLADAERVAADLGIIKPESPGTEANGEPQ